MFKALICGSGSFSSEVDVDEPCSPPTPKRLSRSCKTSSNKNNGNPYSACGRDKFAVVLADLNERKQKIYKQMGSEHKSLVRFRHSSTKGWVPMVIKLKDQNRDKTKLSESKENVKEASKDEKQPRQTKNKSLLSSGGLGTWRYFYLLLVIVLILSCLVLFGRLFVILFTTMGWYFVSAMKDADLGACRLSKKKGYARRLSKKNMESNSVSSSKLHGC